MVRLLAALSVLAGLLMPATSDAFLIQDIAGPASATNGIALGPDGNFWVAEEFAGSVVRLSPSGQIVARYMLTGQPHTVATGPGDRVWVGQNSDKQLVWFDAKAATPTAHPVTLPADCSPDGLAAANDRMYFGCGDGHEVGYVNDDGTGAVTTAAAGGGTVFDLVAAGDKVFAPDFDGAVIRRLGKDLAVESTIGVTAGAAPSGIASDGSTVWVTENASGNLAHFPATQNGGAAAEVTLPAGTLAGPFGITFGSDGRIYVAGKDSHNVLRINSDGTKPQSYPVPDGQPFHIIRGVDDDLWFTDNNRARVVRFVNSAPRVVTVDATHATVDPRGNESTVVFDYGPTTAYGSTTAPTTVPTGTAPVPVSATLSGLAAGTTYHVRARATNGEGETAGADATFTTPAATPPPPVATKLKTKTSFKVKARKKTVVKKLVISGLTGVETATIRCAGTGCPFKQKTYKLKAGKRTFGKSLFKDRKLKNGAVVTVRITAAGRIGTTTKLIVRKGKKPKVKRT